MESKKMFFEVDSTSIDIKQLLEKDFLELSMKVISNANPNVNGSWFTTESMEKSIGTFANKPILGYFENGDFVSHDGQWAYDPETQMDYWDTLGKKGERMLGVIRESDPVEIVEGEDGLKWIKLRCALWVNYSFKQVKRLLKDAIKAKKEGGVAKNVSVEVDITDYDKLPNGVMKINEFNLVGITILGSRNGVKVEPGIENAGLSVVDIMGTEMFEAQKQAIRLAYEKLDSQKNTEEEKKKMNTDQTTLPKTETDSSSTEVNVAAAVDSGVDTDVQAVEPKVEETQATATFENSNSSEGATPETQVEPNIDSDVKPAEGNVGNQDNASVKNNFDAENEATQCPGCVGNIIYDLAYLLERMVEFTNYVAYTSSYYKEQEEDGAIASFLERIKRQNAEDIATIGELVKETGEEYKKSVLAFEKAIEGDTLSSLFEKYEKEKELNEKYDAQIQEINQQKFLQEAENMLNLSNFTEEYKNSTYESCKNGEIKDIADLKNKLAMKMFEDALSSRDSNTSSTPAADSQETINGEVNLTIPVNNPESLKVFEDNTKKNKKNMTSWEILGEYNKK